MDERQAKEPYYHLKWVYNGILEVYLDMEAPISNAKKYLKNIQEKPPKKGYIPNQNWARGQSTTDHISPSDRPSKYYGLIMMTTYRECKMKQEFLNF